MGLKTGYLKLGCEGKDIDMDEKRVVRRLLIGSVRGAVQIFYHHDDSLFIVFGEIQSKGFLKESQLMILRDGKVRW